MIFVCVDVLKSLMDEKIISIIMLAITWSFTVKIYFYFFARVYMKS